MIETTVLILQELYEPQVLRAIASARGIGPVLVALRSVDEAQRSQVEQAGARVVDMSGWVDRGQPWTPEIGRGRVLVLGPHERVGPGMRAELASSGDMVLAARLRTLFRGRRTRFGGFGETREVRVAPAEGIRVCALDGRVWLETDATARRLREPIYRVLSGTMHARIARSIVDARSASLRVVPESSGAIRGRRFGATRSFLYRYVLLAGFLDGRAGFHLAMHKANRVYLTRVLAEEHAGVIRHEAGTRARARRIFRSDARVVEGKPKHPISVIILTKDEEINIRDCLDGVAFSDDVVVFDSLSSDRTVEIARTYANVRVVERAFDNWSSHQNWAVRSIEFRHPWVLYIDADERVDAALAAELQTLADPSSPASAFRLRRKDIFMERWIRHATLYPTWIVRMFRPEKIRYERLVNPVAIVDGPVQEVTGHLIHYPFSKGVTQWFERHNSYSSFEAREQLKVRQGRRRPILDILRSDPNLRRAALKDFFFRLPMRPQLKWMYYVLWRRAFLDGKAGMTYARLQSIYEQMIQIKARERSLGDVGPDS